MNNKRLQTILETAENLMEYLVDDRRIEQWRKEEEERKREDAEIERRARENLAKRRNVSPESLNYDDEEFEYEYEMTKGEYKRQKREAARAKKAQEAAQREAERKKLPFGERDRISVGGFVMPVPTRMPMPPGPGQSTREWDAWVEAENDRTESSFERKSFDDWKKDKERVRQPIDWKRLGSLYPDETNPNRKIPSKVPSSNAGSGLVGAGNSVSGYDSTRKPGGLFGAGSSVSGYDSGSDAPTPQPPSIGRGGRPYPMPGGGSYTPPGRYQPPKPGGRGPGDFPGNPSGYIEYPTWPPKYRPIYPKAPPGDGGYDSGYGKPSPSSPPSSMTPRYGGGMKPIPIPRLPAPRVPNLPIRADSGSSEIIRSQQIERRNAERGFVDKNDRRFTPEPRIPYT